MRLIKYILPFIFIFFSCSRDSDETVQNTRLELTILDGINSPITNAEVKLYPSQNDFDNDTNVVLTLTTDGNGKVTFENLQSTTYYWKINSFCHLNNDINNSENPITANILNPFSIHLTDGGIGNVSVLNNDSEGYNVSYVGLENGSFSIDANGTFPLNEIHTGLYVFTFTGMVSGNVIEHQVLVDCGATTEFSIIQ